MVSGYGIPELANELEDPGFLHKLYARQQVAPSRPPAAKTTNGRKVVKTNVQLNTPMRYAERLTNWLYEQYNLEKPHVQTAFRRRLGSYYHWVENRAHQIVYGDGSVTRAYDDGFEEYKTLWWAPSGMKGLHGVHQLVLHEFAHVIQRENDGYARNSVHNEHFRLALEVLMILAPFGCV